MPWLAMGWALWLGVLTSISPCPLAGNIAAMSFIARKAAAPRHVLLSGLLYTLGRAAAYVVVGAIVTAGLLASGQVARFLQQYLPQILGPVLILVGMLLLDLLKSTATLNLAGIGIQQRAADGGPAWALALGALLALSFCPVSAGLFFGGLIPLAATNNSRLLMPTLYGLGTALPVIAFAFLAAFAAHHVGKAFDRLSQVQRILRIATGAVFVVAGIYYCLRHIYGLAL